jgi:uncharacterized protein
MESLTLVLLCVFAFAAGFVDAIVGGGGLVQLPALLILLPSHAIPTIFGTNKCSSIAGTAMATWRYSRKVQIDWRMIGPAAGTAFVFSFLGSRAVSMLNPAVLRPVILVLLFIVAIYVYLAKNTGMIHEPKHPHERARWFGLLTGATLGFYDGFFGPGTGSFLIFIFVGFFGFDFLFASASAKVINLGTNLASVIYFAATDHILYHAALPMAACNILGSLAGSRLAILKGSSFIRVFFLGVVGALIAKLGWDQFGK